MCQIKTWIDLKRIKVHDDGAGVTISRKEYVVTQGKSFFAEGTEIKNFRNEGGASTYAQYRADVDDFTGINNFLIKYIKGLL